MENRLKVEIICVDVGREVIDQKFAVCKDKKTKKVLPVYKKGSH